MYYSADCTEWTKLYFLAKYHVFQDNLAEF